MKTSTVLRCAVLTFLLAAGVDRVSAADKTDKPITFSAPLPAGWFVKKDQEMPADAGVKGHMLIVQNTNRSSIIIVGLLEFTPADQKKGFEQNARNHFAGFIDGFNPDRKGKVENAKFELKKIDNRDTAEATGRIVTAETTFYFHGRCWLSNQRLISWDAVRLGSAIDDDPDVAAIAKSLHVAD